jgi:hypothetical protein
MRRDWKLKSAVWHSVSIQTMAEVRRVGTDHFDR